MKDIAVSSYFLPIISAERELIGNNKLFLIFSYLSREARTYIGGNKEKRIAAGKTRTKRTTAASVPRCCGHGHYRYRVG